MGSTIERNETACSNEAVHLIAGAGRAASPIFRSILVAVDGGEPTRWAARAAVKLSEPGTKVSLVHAINPTTDCYSSGEPPEEPCPISAQNDFVLSRWADEIPGELLGDRICREGDINRQVVAAARDSRADLLVIGTHGRHALGRLLLGSTAVYVLRHLPCAVLVVGRGAQSVTPPANPARIVVGVHDGCRPSMAALEMAARLAARHHARLAMVHVVPCAPAFRPDIDVARDDDLTPRLRELGELFLASLPIPANGASDVQRRVREGDIAGELLTVATEWNADLIVIGTHCRHGLGRLILGSTAEKIACGAPCPVLCVPSSDCEYFPHSGTRQLTK